MIDGCTGFWLVQGIFPSITACCSIHDMGGTDGMLLDCLQHGLPSWAWAISAACVAAMVALRPIYNWMQRRGWVK